MISVQKSLRLHIALLGRVNAGKSSFLNLVAGQDVSIASAVAGTTTDVVEKAQELIPLGPVVWLDTAGFGDQTELGKQRLSRTLKALDKADIAVLVCEGARIETEEKQIMAEAARRNLPLIKIFNKADIFPVPEEADGIPVNSTDLSSRDRVLNRFKAELIKKAPEDIMNPPTLIGDIVKDGGSVVLVIPLDDQAPKGRLLPLQVQVIRDGLDHGCSVTAVRDSEYAGLLSRLATPPDLVIIDSSVVGTIIPQTPAEIPLTTFSILFARLKGDLSKLVEGARALTELQDGDKVLIAESCTHHAAKNDIGRVKIPELIRRKTGKQPEFIHLAGCDFPDDLADFRLVIQCGGCMSNRRTILSRINRCESFGVPITNYGVCLSALQGFLPRVIAPFHHLREAEAASPHRLAVS